MALDTKLVGGLTGTAADVNASRQLKVVPETDVATNPGNVGCVRVFNETDGGAITGTPRLLSPETSPDYRQRSGLDMNVFNDTFNYANQDTGKYNYLSTNITIAQSSGALVTNATSITTINSAASYRTQRSIPLFGQQAQIYTEFNASLSAALTTNTTIDYGMFITSGSSPYAPSDGAYFRINPSGFFGVVNYNGVETATSVFTFTHTINQVYEFLIAITEREVNFWIDDILYATITCPSSQGQPFMSAGLPVQIRHAIGGTAAAAALSLKVFDICVQQGDIAYNMPMGVQQALSGCGPQVQQGASTGGQLTTYALGAEPGAVTLTASTAPATNSLGGLFLLPAAITTAASDYPLFAWLNPAGTTAIHGKTFLCTGIRVGELTVTTALAGGPLIVTYALGFGSTASTLATTETTTFTSGTTKIARKIPLGTQALAATAAVGSLSPGFQTDFGDAPIAINPGEYLHIIIRCLGTTTTAGAPRGSVAVFGYFR